jgi:hypothetical protein
VDVCTDCLLVHADLSLPTFWPRMGRPDRACLFASARWVVIYPFFVHADTFGRGVVVYVGPWKMPSLSINCCYTHGAPTIIMT